MNDGGTAFPQPDDSEPGMSVRDYFAAKAMQGAIANGALERIAANIRAEKHDITLEEMANATNAVLARMLYKIADAMLRAREATP